MSRSRLIPGKTRMADFMAARPAGIAPQRDSVAEFSGKLKRCGKGIRLRDRLRQCAANLSANPAQVAWIKRIFPDAAARRDLLERNRRPSRPPALPSLPR